ncbi:MAG: hypothetical protein LBU42_03205 [Prevotellaceae bacterium]|jgi:hypothetical protein|nr:hypothetical protein [Prevotellaceae bacterium]
MKTYITLAPYVVFNIHTGGQKKEYALKKGDTVALPEDDIAVRALLARKQIEESAALAGEKKAIKTTKKQK